MSLGPVVLVSHDVVPGQPLAAGFVLTPPWRAELVAPDPFGHRLMSCTSRE